MHRFTRAFESALILAVSTFLAASVQATPSTIIIPVITPTDLDPTSPFLTFSTLTPSKLRGSQLGDDTAMSPTGHTAPAIFTVQPTKYCKLHKEEDIKKETAIDVGEFTGVSIGPRVVLTSKHPLEKLLNSHGSNYGAIASAIKRIQCKPSLCKTPSKRPKGCACIEEMACDLTAPGDYALCLRAPDVEGWEPFAHINTGFIWKGPYSVQSFGCRRNCTGDTTDKKYSDALNYFTNIQEVPSDEGCKPDPGEIYLDYPSCPGDSGSPVFAETGDIDSVVAVVAKEVCDNCESKSPCTTVVPISCDYVSEWRRNASRNSRKEVDICGIADFSHGCLGNLHNPSLCDCPTINYYPR
ncbi:MAG: hypothetical protein AAGC60_26790 [Acidobacteriota bacterium]